MAKLSCLRLQPRSFLGSIGVLLMSWKVNFQVVRTASQNSIGIFLLIMSSLDQTFCRGTQREYSSKPLNIALLNVF